MSRASDTLPAKYFDEKYQSDIDPWQFRSSPYEREKYSSTLAALTRPTYPMALEIGCSIGVFTSMLAPRCERLLAIDASQTALDAAQKHRPENVQFEERMLPHGFPAGRFDLIVLSEILYYFDRRDLADVAARCCQALNPGGELLLCHWLGETDYPLSGTDASDLFATSVSMRVPARQILRDDVYRLELLSERLA